MKIDLSNMYARIISYNNNEPLKISGYCIDDIRNTITLHIVNDTVKTFKMYEVKIFN